MPLKCSPTTFRDRKAICLESDTLQVITLTGCGHLASVRIPDVDVNPMWEPPWAGIEPEDWDLDKHVPIYGPGEGRLLASLAGHSLCLNHFGDLTEAEIEANGYFHGEASNLPWTVFDQRAEDGEARLGNSGRLVIRASGTEPLIRVMAEGDDAELVKQVVNDIAGVVATTAA